MVVNEFQLRANEDRESMEAAMSHHCTNDLCIAKILWQHTLQGHQTWFAGKKLLSSVMFIYH